jgi:hypothetical protein
MGCIGIFGWAQTRCYETCYCSCWEKILGISNDSKEWIVNSTKAYGRTEERVKGGVET